MEFKTKLLHFTLNVLSISLSMLMHAYHAYKERNSTNIHVSLHAPTMQIRGETDMLL